MSGLLFCGDPHGRFDRIRQRVQQEQPEAVVLLGDQTPLEDGELSRLEEWAPVYYILGNHDTDRARHLERHLEELPADRDLTGRVVTLGGYQVAGLGGVFRGKVWWPGESPLWASRRECARFTPVHTKYRGGPPVKQWSSIWREDYEVLANARADILVTHEAPESSRKGFRHIGDLARTMGAQAVVHGHLHLGYRAAIDGGIWVVGTDQAGRGSLDMVTERQVLAGLGADPEAGGGAA